MVIFFPETASAELDPIFGTEPAFTQVSFKTAPAECRRVTRNRVECWLPFARTYFSGRGTSPAIDRSTSRVPAMLARLMPVLFHRPGWALREVRIASYYLLETRSSNCRSDGALSAPVPEPRKRLRKSTDRPRGLHNSTSALMPSK
jgi:hypothetical protein